MPLMKLNPLASVDFRFISTFLYACVMISERSLRMNSYVFRAILSIQEFLSCIKLKTTCPLRALALYLNSLQLSINCAIMTSLNPDLTQSPFLESTRSSMSTRGYVPGNVKEASTL